MQENERRYELRIVHLYPDLLNLYGDKGNIECMRKRLEWRGFGASVSACTTQDPTLDCDNTDIIFLGGGSDREQALVCERLLEKKEALKAYAERGGVIVAVCGGYQLLGRYYKTAAAEIEGLNILDIYTEAGDTRLIGNVVLESEWVSRPIVGFENHAGRTVIGRHTPLGKVVYGHGNTGESGAEGVVYKNVIATYLHGPLLPKNPMLCDLILTRALRGRYPDFDRLAPLEDDLEHLANRYITDRFAAHRQYGI